MSFRPGVFPLISGPCQEYSCNPSPAGGAVAALQSTNQIAGPRFYSGGGGPGGCNVCSLQTLTRVTSLLRRLVFVLDLFTRRRLVCVGYSLPSLHVFQKREGILQSRQIQEEITGNTEWVGFSVTFSHLAARWKHGQQISVLLIQTSLLVITTHCIRLKYQAALCSKDQIFL